MPIHQGKQETRRTLICPFLTEDRLSLPIAASANSRIALTAARIPPHESPQVDCSSTHAAQMITWSK